MELRKMLFRPDSPEVRDALRWLKKRPRPRGRVTIRKYVRGRLLWTLERENLFVNAGLPCLANLLANQGSGEFVSAVGYGSSGTPATVNDTGLNATPAYYNAPVSATFTGTATTAIGWAIGTTDYGAQGIAVQELGLFANTAAIVLPDIVGVTAFPAWAASTAKTIGALIKDSNGNLQRCTGITGAGDTGSAAPTWATTLNATTADNQVTWTLVALHSTPGPMIAHTTVPEFTVAAGATYQGTWQLTF
jgi:hypothetical protein